jgi:His-Xaa-Ser system protein (TIGR03982 family)
MIKTVFQLVVIVFCITWLGKNIVAPAMAYVYFQTDYKRLASQCANAMDETWFVEQEGLDELEQSAEIHLMVCHEYDKTRKVMLVMGLSENVLAYLGLKALETEQQPVSRLVEQHRFRER